MHQSMCLNLARSGGVVMILTRSLGMSSAPVMGLMGRRIPLGIIKGVIDHNSVQRIPIETQLAVAAKLGSSGRDNWIVRPMTGLGFRSI